MTTTHYELLEVIPTASQETIRAAYKSMVQRYHPDKNADDPNAAEMTKKIVAAYQVLSDTELRAKYDVEMARLTKPTAEKSKVPPASESHATSNPAPKTPTNAGRGPSKSYSDFLDGQSRSPNEPRGHDGSSRPRDFGTSRGSKKAGFRIAAGFWTFVLTTLVMTLAVPVTWAMAVGILAGLIVGASQPAPEKSRTIGIGGWIYIALVGLTAYGSYFKSRSIAKGQTNQTTQTDAAPQSQAALQTDYGSSKQQPIIEDLYNRILADAERRHPELNPDVPNRFSEANTNWVAERVKVYQKSGLNSAQALQAAMQEYEAAQQRQQ